MLVQLIDVAIDWATSVDENKHSMSSLQVLSSS